MIFFKTFLRAVKISQFTGLICGEAILSRDLMGEIFRIIITVFASNDVAPQIFIFRIRIHFVIFLEESCHSFYTLHFT